MRKSLRVGSVAGIGIFLHWSFLLLAAGLVALFIAWEGPTLTAVSSIAVIFGIFGCVVLHELGHALAARAFDVPTRSITLYPIGGLARLERIPSEPMKEFWIAVAGPAVNVAIALVLGALVIATGRPLSPSVLTEPFQDPIKTLAWMNVGLAAFNMLPAFPMDGGRVLRAILALNRDYASATQTAANVGQVMAMLFGLIGILIGNIVLIFIAVFVYFGARSESQRAMFRSFTHGATVRNAMMTRFAVLRVDDTLGDAVDELLAGSDHDFPVVRETDSGLDVTGILQRQTLIQALSRHDRSEPVEAFADEPCFLAEDDEMLEDVFIKMNESQCSTVPVVKGGNLVGLLTLENVGEMVMVASALEQRDVSRSAQIASSRTLASGNETPESTPLLPPNASSAERAPEDH
jgi:Zn-dependent protease